MKTNHTSRRHFLQGVGGSVLALPMMSSLSKACNGTAQNPKYFAFLSSQHGGIDPSNMYPTTATGNTTALYDYLDHTMRWDRLENLLSSTTNAFNPNGLPELSPVLGNFLNPYLDQLNVINGLDLMWGGGHQQGGYLGNFHGNDSRDFDTGIDDRFTLDPMETIDQVMANSPNFYAQEDPVSAKTMNIGSGASVVFSRQGSKILQQDYINWGSLTGLFDSMFSTGGQLAQSENQISVVDGVIEDYRRLTQSQYGPGKRLSYDDRNRLNGFIDQLNDLESRLQNRVLTCQAQVQRPADGRSFTYNDRDLSNLSNDWSDYLDIIFLGFQCGRSRIATMAPNASTDFVGDWHQDIAHQHLNAAPQEQLTRSYRWISEHIFKAMLDRLNVDAGCGDGSSYLDHTAFVWQHECGKYTHDGTSLPTVLAGGASGYFQGGHYVDYRSLNNLGAARWSEDLRPGLPQNRWLNTLLLSMGINETEFRRDDMPGFGDPWQGDNNGIHDGHEAWNAQVMADCNEPMPLIV